VTDRATAALLAVVLVLIGVALPARAEATSELIVTGLHDAEGTVWHAQDQFVLEWDPNPSPLDAVFWYAVRGPNGEDLPGFEPEMTQFNWAYVSVPPVPGIYSFEIVDSDGHLAGPLQSVPLLFDNARPPSVAVWAPTWVAAGSPVPIRITPPTAALPLSGIKGYAVSIDSAPDASPCVHPARCTLEETDLPRGIDDTSVSLLAPQEGISYVHAVAVSGSRVDSELVATQPIRVDGTPPAVRLEGAPDGWAAGPVKVTARASDALSGMAVAGSGGPATALEVDGGAPLLTPGDAATTTVAGEGTHRVGYWARDAVGNAGDGSLPFAQPATATVRIDETEPTVRFAARDPGDPERIEASVDDKLSGPAADRGEIELRSVGSHGSFETLPTDAERGRLVARWSSDDYPRGNYEFRAVGYDAAGNAATSTLGEDGAPLVLHNPVKRVARLAFGFGAGKLVFQRCSRTDGVRHCHRAVVRSFAKRPASRAVPCCHRAVVGGVLLDAGGAPLAGQSVDVIETFARGSRPRTRTTAVTTDARGAFRDRLKPGPSRRVSTEFAGTRRLTRASGRQLRLRVRAAILLKASTSRVRVGGAPVVFHGRVVHPEARIPPTGLPVELEFRLPGLAWAEFRTLQTDSAGRFAYPYSFSDDDSSGVRFQFRAFVPATGNWPFAPATSRPLPVVG
jgi:hypothetical protein